MFKVNNKDNRTTQMALFWRCSGVVLGVASVLDVQSLFFFIKENWICAMTRYHAESNINILSTRNLLIESDIRQWSHPYNDTIALLWAKANNRTRILKEFWFRSLTYTVKLSFHNLLERIGLKLDVQGRGGGNILDIEGQRGWGVLKIRQFSWTSYYLTLP